MSNENIPTHEPDEITAGLSARWIKDLPLYSPDDGWALQYSFASATELHSVDASDNGDGRWLVNIPATTTAGWSAGDYAVTAIATKDPDKFLVWSGWIKVNPDLTTSIPEGYDPRSHVKRVLDAIEAVIEGRASRDQQSLEIDGYRLDRTPLTDLLALRSKYLQEYRAEKQAADLAKGLETGNRVLVRF